MLETNMFLDQNWNQIISGLIIFLDLIFFHYTFFRPKLLRPYIYHLEPEIVLDQHFFGPKFFCTNNLLGLISFLPIMFWTQHLFCQNCFQPQSFWCNIFFYPRFLFLKKNSLTQNFFDPKFFCPKMNFRQFWFWT